MSALPLNFSSNFRHFLQQANTISRIPFANPKKRRTQCDSHCFHIWTMLSLVVPTVHKHCNAGGYWFNMEQRGMRPYTVRSRGQVSFSPLYYSPGICLPPLLPVCSDIYFRRILGLDGMSPCSQGGLRGCHQNWHWRCCNKWLLITNSLFMVNVSFSFIFINNYGRMSVLLRIVI